MSADTREHAIAEAREMRIKNPLLRQLCFAAGWVTFALGIVGLLLPVVPTTPFLLLSAALWARSSERFFVWLLTHRHLGPPLAKYRRHGVIEPRAKVLAIGMIAVTMGISIVFFVPVTAVKILLTVIAVAVCTWIGTRPGHPA